jgi:hypothetical protein
MGTWKRFHWECGGRARHGPDLGARDRHIERFHRECGRSTWTHSLKDRETTTWPSRWSPMGLWNDSRGAWCSTWNELAEGASTPGERWSAAHGHMERFAGCVVFHVERARRGSAYPGRALVSCPWTHVPMGNQRLGPGSRFAILQQVRPGGTPAWERFAGVRGVSRGTRSLRNRDATTGRALDGRPWAHGAIRGSGGVPRGTRPPRIAKRLPGERWLAADGHTERSWRAGCSTWNALVGGIAKRVPGRAWRERHRRRSRACATGALGAELSHEGVELSEESRELSRSVVCIETAWIRQEPDLCAADGRLLQATNGAGMSECRAIRA